MASAPRRHCRVDCRYEAAQPDAASVSIHYLDSSDDFEITAASLPDAFRLLGARGWHLAAVTHRRVKRRSPAGRPAAGFTRVDAYYFSRPDEPARPGINSGESGAMPTQ